MRRPLPISECAGDAAGVLLEPFAVVRVPFPFTDRAVRRRRPALVISGSDFQRDSAHVLLAMITTARRSGWPLDWPIHDLVPTGLVEACLVRIKLFSLDERLILGQLGQLAAIDRRGVRTSLRQLIPACKISDHGPL
jgi:mRNA interferase MazF